MLCAASNGTLYRFDDSTGSTLTATAIATVPAGTVYRGLAYLF